MKKKKTTRVYLRPITARDEHEFLALVKTSRKFHSPWVAPPAKREQFRKFLRRNDGVNLSCFLLCATANSEIVGVFNLRQITGGALQSAYLGFFIGQQFAGQGLMTEGLELLTNHAFRKLKLHRIEANIQPKNTSSKKLVKRAGFKKEGFSPRYLKIRGRWRDHERWAIVKGG